MLRTQTMDIYKFRKKLTRYLKGKSNETENALIESWYKSYDIDEKPLEDNETEGLKQSIQNKINAAVSRPPIIQLPIFRVAASVTIIAGIALFTSRIYQKKDVPRVDFYTIQTGTNGVKQVVLPDSSVIWLNAASTLRVPNAFNGKLREVSLLEGEAFFDVKRNPLHPFIAHTAGVDVQVLGTSFNVSAYKNLKDIRVVVATGKVGVTKKGDVLAMLLPGQQLSYDTKTGRYSQQAVNAAEAQSWKAGYTYLKQASFDELALVIKNIFGLKLKAGDSRVNTYRFSMRVQHNLPAEEILKVICQMHNTHFRKEGDEIILY